MPAPRKVALLIANGRFDDAELSVLTAPAADVAALREVLLDPSIGGFDEVAALNDADFTQTYEAIGRLFGVESSDDTIVLYYSGHGLPDERGHLYLATRNTSAANPDGNSIPAAEIKRMMGGSRSRRQILILDCCYSGAFGAAKDRALLPISPETFKTQGFGQHVLTASRSVERAYEGNQEIDGIETSLFTHFLIRGLKTGEAAREGEDRVSVGDIYKYVYEGVTRHTHKMRPQMWVDEGQGDLVIARNPKPYQLPDELERMLESDDRFVREGAVRILGRWLHEPDAAQRGLAVRVLEALNKSEENRFVAIAIEDVLQQPSAVDESAAAIRADHAERQLARTRRIGRIFLVVAIVALAGAFYFSLQLTNTYEHLSAMEQDREQARKEAVTQAARVDQRTAERDEARDAANAQAARVGQLTVERDEAQMSLARANATIAQLEEELSERSPSRAALAQDAAAKCGGRVLGGTGFQCRMGDDWGPVMLAIPPGSFTMGSPENEAGRDADEGQHAVQIEKPFAIGKYEVTFDEYVRFTRSSGRRTPNDSGWGKGRRPVISVSWHDAKAYAAWLSKRTDQTFRLPTEAEWEYAARAGTTGPFSFSTAISPNKANYNARASYAGSKTGKTRRRTEEVGSFSNYANAWGLHDVHGNVGEWVEDCYGPYAVAPTGGAAARDSSCETRVVRGGSWWLAPRFIRSAARGSLEAVKRFDDLGFRLAQDL